MARMLRLGVNIDHVATLRNARGGCHPDPLRAAHLAATAGADGITTHLREDRRHISDDDIVRLRDEITLPINMEMAATAEMTAIALRHRPNAVCVVPERREERTTEGGLNVVGQRPILAVLTQRMKEAGIRVSLFIEPEMIQLEAAVMVGAPVVELHTGAYCNAKGTSRDYELARLATAATQAVTMGLECHAGHGLDYDTVGPVAAVLAISELNIGHFLVGEAIFSGLNHAIQRMRTLIDQARVAAATAATSIAGAP
ncbi:Pyridoxine 5'-phosphate synthase [invertebrate metagenome]|uniref:Pyridoxine 5'-phosphate synthase n=1 Tax=invertebrate metagenome TaxID=1711999 RepID=A0A484H4D4_9ZZZZ